MATNWPGARSDDLIGMSLAKRAFGASMKLVPSCSLTSVPVTLATTPLTRGWALPPGAPESTAEANDARAGVGATVGTAVAAGAGVTAGLVSDGLSSPPQAAAAMAMTTVETSRVTSFMAGSP